MRGGMLILVLLATLSDTVVLTVYPHVVMAGYSVRITCRVPRHAANRTVAWGFEHWTSTARQLDGLDAPITWQSTWAHVPCDPGRAFCAVERADGQHTYRTSSLLVAGCEGGGR